MFKGKERPRDCRFGGERNAKHQAIQNGEVCRASHELHKLKVEVRRSLAENDVVGQGFFGLFIEGTDSLAWDQTSRRLANANSQLGSMSRRGVFGRSIAAMLKKAVPMSVDT